MLTPKFITRLLPALAITILSAACSDVTAPPPADDVEASDAPPSLHGPNFALLNAPIGSVGRVTVPYPSVTCSSIPVLRLRSIAVKGPTVFPRPSVVAYQQRVTLAATLYQLVNGQWVAVAKSGAQDLEVFNATNMGTTFKLAEFLPSGPGSYYVATEIAWWSRRSEMQGFVVNGSQWLSYMHNSDYSPVGAASVGGGYCTIG